MAIKKLAEKILELFNKYKFLILIIALGLILMLIPIPAKSDTDPEEQTITPTDTFTLEDKLAEILRSIEGVGEVKVMLTIAEGEEIRYQTNGTISKDGGSAKEDLDTVTVTDASRNQSGLIKQTIPPTYLGAIIACHGADDPVIRYAITDAVSKATGLRANQISVLK